MPSYSVEMRAVISAANAEEADALADAMCMAAMDDYGPNRPGNTIGVPVLAEMTVEAVADRRRAE